MRTDSLPLPQMEGTAPHPMAASGCTPMVTMLNSPRMADLRSGGDRSCTADEEVTKREEVAKPAKKKQRACTSTTGMAPATHSAHPIHRVPEESLAPTLSLLRANGRTKRMLTMAPAPTAPRMRPVFLGFPCINAGTI